MGIKSKLKSLKRHFVVHVKDVNRPYQINLCSKNRFKGQIAIVTGGSGVIGRSICFRLAAEGMKVYVGGTNINRIKSVVDEITSAGYLAESLVCNQLEETSVISAITSVIDKEGKISLLVCCAGGGARDKMKSFVEQEMNVIDSVININLRGSIMVSHEVAKQMVSQKYGNIIIISSTVGVCGMPRYSEYSAAKAGLIGFVKSIAMELGKGGIRINCVTPGIVQRGSIDDNQMEQIKRTNWLESYGKPEDVSNMVAYLQSEEASFITGQNFIVDGGRSLGLKN